MRDTDEALAIIRRIGPVVMSSTVDTSGKVAAALRRCVGMMMADYNMIHMATFATVFATILDMARQCGATLVTMDRVRKAALAETPHSLMATQTVLAIVRLTMACESRIVTAMTFTSSNQVDDISLALNEAFGQTSEAASDDLDAYTYMALITLWGDVTKHLADRGRQLPRIISYNYQMVMPSLRMAQLVYADPSRSTELRDENNVVHPAFMPLQGTMLTA